MRTYHFTRFFIVEKTYIFFTKEEEILKNEGKIFEDDFKTSIPEEVYCYRPPDSSIGFDVEKSSQRFSLKSPFDFILCKNGQMYCLELKSSKEKRMSFGDNNSSMIKLRQVRNLLDAERSGAVSGLILNFRQLEETYYVSAGKFMDFVHQTTKKSVNIDDVRQFGILVPSIKKITRYRYNLGVIWKT